MLHSGAFTKGIMTFGIFWPCIAKYDLVLLLMTFSDDIYQVEPVSPKILEYFWFFWKIATLRHTKNLFFD